MIATLLLAAEGAARRPEVRSHLYAPSMGSSSRRFDLQMDTLERYVAAGRPVDCIVTGNSTALMGVDPAALGRAYRSASGRDLHCFNFGVAGMTASAAAAIAPILVRRYRPELLVYVVTARDVDETVDGPLLAQTPWVRYQAGVFSWNGFLVEHSAAFRYFLLYRQWLDPSRWPAAVSSSGTTEDGYFPLDSSAPVTQDLWARAQRYLAAAAERPPSRAELRAFADVLRLGARTRVVLVEAPVRDQLHTWARQVGTFYTAAITAMEETARAEGVPFWHVRADEVIGEDGWADLAHLNRHGATQFSEWLGEQISRAGKGAAPEPAGAEEKHR